MVALSIITVVKNNAEGLRRTIESAKSQDFSDWELIIVYGQSHDTTYQFAMESIREDSRITLVEQLDKGIYEAMNLGISKARAEFLWFMNSGDRFYSPTSLISGLGVIRNSELGFVVGGYKIENDRRLFHQAPGRLTQIKFALSRRGACHQAMVFRKEPVMQSGNFDTKFRLAADYKLCLKLITNSGANKLSEILAVMEPGGLSDQNLRVMHLEKAAIRREIFANNPPARVLGWCWMKAARSKAILRGLGNGKKHPLG